MKKGLVGLLLAVTLGLASCDNDDSASVSGSNSGSSVSTSVDPSASTGSSSISAPVGATEWDANAKSIMNEVIGEELPFVALKDDYVCSKETDETGDYVQIYDEDSVNHLTNYGDTLVSNGYTYYSESTENGITDYFYVKDDIVVQYVFAASEGNTIFAWVETPTAQTTDTAWPSDLSALMVNLLQEELPFVALADNYDYESNQIYIYDNSNVNYLVTYGATLEANGYELVYNDESNGYPIYEYVKNINSNTMIVVDFDYYPGDEYTYPCNEIAARLSHLTTEWPNEAIAEIIASENRTMIPEFGALTTYEYYCATDAITIVGDVDDKNIGTGYTDCAKENGLLVGLDIDWNLFEYYEYLYDWEENFAVTMSSSFEENATSGYFSITISKSEKTYDSLESAFPADAIITFLGDVTTEIPSFAIAEGNTYKVINEEADEFGTPASLSILAIDNGTIGTDSLEDTYKTTVTNAGYTVDDGQYEDYGYIATSADNKVGLTFYTESGVFYLYISLVTE